MTKNFLIAFFLLYCFALYGQSGDVPANAQPGKCYAKCLMPDRFERELRLPVYIGPEYDDPFVKKQQFRALVSTLPLSWQPLNKKGSIIKQGQDTIVNVWVVTDTIQIQDFRWVTIVITNGGEAMGGYIAWREVLCGDKVSASIVMEIQKKLEQRGYDSGVIDNVMGSRTKQALTKFQKDHSLPVGNLDIETLRALEVQY